VLSWVTDVKQTGFVSLTLWRRKETKTENAAANPFFVSVSLPR
jgi:hypothetical protein